MLRMMEKNVSVEAPKNHRDLIVGVFEDCERRFAEIMKSETGK